jgi:SHS2 domain-containing protein
MRRYEILSHTADTGIVARGASPARAFENTAFAMFDLMFDLSRVRATDQCRVEVEGEAMGELLVAWLSALLAEAEIRGLVFSEFAVEELAGGYLKGRAAGASAAGRELRGPPVKAVTYHDLAVEQVRGGWRVQVIFDV